MIILEKEHGLTHSSKNLGSGKHVLMLISSSPLITFQKVQGKNPTSSDLTNILESKQCVAIQKIREEDFHYL